ALRRTWPRLPRSPSRHRRRGVSAYPDRARPESPHTVSSGPHFISQCSHTLLARTSPACPSGDGGLGTRFPLGRTIDLGHDRLVVATASPVPPPAADPTPGRANPRRPAKAQTPWVRPPGAYVRKGSLAAPRRGGACGGADVQRIGPIRLAAG